MKGFCGIALQMRISDSDFFFLSIIIKEECDLSINIDRAIKLGNLVAHRKIRIEIGFPIKTRAGIETAIQCFPDK